MHLRSLSASKVPRVDAVFDAGLTMCGLTLSASASRHQQGQAVEEDNTNLKYTDDGEWVCLSQHASDPGHVQRAQLASISATSQRCVV